MPIDAAHIAQPAHDTVSAEAAPTNIVQITSAVNRRKCHQHRLHPHAGQFCYRLLQFGQKFRQLRAGLVVPLGVGGDAGPVEITVVAAVGHQRPAGVHTTGHVVLHQRESLADGGAHLGAVHHLQPLRGVLGHDLRKMKMIAHGGVRHRGLQQRISINIGTLHDLPSLTSFYII